ncbi:MAG TPA: M23 family metallopeptidase [Pyrinomonadaceae bacterium]|nr:M23 family metallopeptidase [Pyrinomonadaceae bacterium]
MKRRLITLAVIIPALAILSYFGGDKLILVGRIAQLYAAAPDERLAMPVAGVSKSKVSDSWLAPRSGGERQHQGQDIFAPRGTPVLSATDGYVVRVGENRLGGKTVSVMGAGGRMYYYAHLDAYAPNLGLGEYVTPKTVLGFVGTTGNAAGTPPHLHFGVYSTKGAINPLPMLSERVEATPAGKAAKARLGKERN